MRRITMPAALVLILFVGFAVQAQERDRPVQSEAERTEKPRLKPETEREKVLISMIEELRQEVAALRRELSAMRGRQPRERARDGDRLASPEQSVRREAPRETDLRDGVRRDEPREGMRRSPEALRDRPITKEREGTSDRAAVNTKVWNQAKRIFAAYDKNKDGFASFEEWLQMREGEMTDERRERERKHFATPAGKDSKITQEEFYRWMLSRQRGSRDSD